MTTKPTADELRSLVAELKPRSPQEVMGSAASSSLMSSMLTATFTSVGLSVAATVVMFALGAGPADSAAAPQVATDVADTKVTDAADPNTNSEPTTEPTVAATPDESNSDPDSMKTAIEVMGIGEAAAPDSKPETLENRLDRILDGLE